MDKPKIIFNDEPETINKLFKNDLKIEFNSLQEIPSCMHLHVDVHRGVKVLKLTNAN